jgi:hypothetical protein
MTHQGFQVSLGEHGAGQWIAVFYIGRGGHEPVAAAGTAQEPTRWRAVLRAAIQALSPSIGRDSLRCRRFPRKKQRLCRLFRPVHLALGMKLSRTPADPDGALSKGRLAMRTFRVVAASLTLLSAVGWAPPPRR